MMSTQRSWRALICLLWVMLAGVFSHSVQAKPEFYLVTYGPGTEVWERFGHNALWLRDRVSGEDRLFNYGFFDFQQKGFFKNFLLGRMLYFAAATEPSDEFAFYQRYNRTIQYQRLNLNDDQAQRLADVLKRSVQPEYREYLYDYFLDNCSTRVRDAIDEALGQHLAQQSETLSAETTFRESALTLVQDDFLLYLGIQLGLGRMTDEVINQWQYFYLPVQFSEFLQNVTNDEQQPLTGPTETFYQGHVPPTELKPPYLAFTVLLLASVLLMVLPYALVRKGSRWRLLGVRLWWALTGLGGLLLCFLWFATDHQAAWRNENVLLLMPLSLGLAVSPFARASRSLSLLLFASLILALIMKLTPTHQYNYDLLLWLVPAQCLALYLWYRMAQQKNSTV